MTILQLILNKNISSLEIKLKDELFDRNKRNKNLNNREILAKLAELKKLYILFSTQ